MAESARVGDIEVSQDLDFERRARTTRGVAAVVFGLLLLAGLLGLLGRSGPLSDASAEDGRALRVDYERFLRFKSPTELVFTLGTGRGATRVALAADYLEGFRLSGFSAAPRSTTVAADRTVFTFDQRAPSRISLTLEPREIGYQGGTVYGPRGSRLSFAQWVWP